MTLVGGAALYMLGGQIAGQMAEMMRRSLALSRERGDWTRRTCCPRWPVPRPMALDVARRCSAAITLAAILAPLALGGWSFSSQALMPQFNRLNPHRRRQAHVRDAQS